MKELFVNWYSNRPALWEVVLMIICIFAIGLSGFLLLEWAVEWVIKEFF
jgi:hypothetical protein